MIILSEESLNKLTPNHMGVKKKIRAGFISIGNDTMKHLVIEDFLLKQPLFERFTVDDVKAKLDSLYPGRDFCQDNLREDLCSLTIEAFPYKLIKETYYPKNARGQRTEFILTARIKKIKNGAD